MKGLCFILKAKKKKDPQFYGIKGINQNFELIDGIVLNNEVLSKEQFRKFFPSLIEQVKKEDFDRFHEVLAGLQKITHITGEKGNVKTTTEYVSDLEAISKLFSSTILKGLGGTIELFSVFNFKKSGAPEAYYLMDSDDLPSSINGYGGKVIHNTKENLDALVKQGYNAVKLNQAFTSHLNGFRAQVSSKSEFSKDHRKALHQWAYYHMEKRYNEVRTQRKKMVGSARNISLATYFWGNSRNKHGYIAEAYINHLTLSHAQLLTAERVERFKQSVVSEMGGYSSPSLYSLLYATKGQVGSQLSGDIVVIDEQGRVIFNVQSKATRGLNYNVNITYQKFIQNLYTARDIYEKYFYSNQQITEQDIDALFKAFSTQVWAPLNREVNELIKDLLT